MKKRHIFGVISFLLIINACNQNSDLEKNNEEIKNKTSTEISTEEITEPNTGKNTKITSNENIGSPIILNGNFKDIYWYVAKESNYTQYFIITNSNIIYSLTKSDNYVGTKKSGNITFLNSDSTAFEYRWDGSISGSEKSNKILVVDNEILILANGFDCTNSIGSTHILYKDLDAYNNNNLPFMGFGKVSQNDYNEWIVFTPSGKCYKRYLNREKNELLIICGTWEKIDTQTYKLYWGEDNTNKYDILIGRKLYQNAANSSTIIALNLNVTNY